MVSRQEGLRACSHDRPVARAATCTTEPVCQQPGSGCPTEGLCCDRTFSVTTGVVGFHIATWSIVSRHGSSTARAVVSRQGMPCHKRVPRQAGRVGSQQRLHCRDRDVLALCRDRECCVATGLGLGLSDWGRDRDSYVTTKAWWPNAVTEILCCDKVGCKAGSVLCRDSGDSVWH